LNPTKNFRCKRLARGLPLETPGAITGNVVFFIGKTSRLFVIYRSDNGSKASTNTIGRQTESARMTSHQGNSIRRLAHCLHTN
jgi:hypothetical protein